MAAIENQDAWAFGYQLGKAAQRAGRVWKLEVGGDLSGLGDVFCRHGLWMFGKGGRILESWLK